jgi:hypothetical protein
MLFKLLPEEGFGMSKKVFSGSFEFSNSGGCRNFDTYNMNPAFCIKVVHDPTQVFFRLMIKGEVSQDGRTLLKDPDQFRFSVGAQLYRIQANSFPVKPGTLSFVAFSNPIMQTGADGKYTSALSGCVSPCTPLPAGVYILVLSTFNPQQLATWDLAIFSSYDIEVAKY